MSIMKVVLIGTGILYLLKPDIFQRWFWKDTAISQQVLSPEQNKVYMRILGVAFIVAGILFF